MFRANDEKYFIRNKQIDTKYFSKNGYHSFHFPHYYSGTQAKNYQNFVNLVDNFTFL